MAIEAHCDMPELLQLVEAALDEIALLVALLAACLRTIVSRDLAM
jgi:hypothetical protein